MFLEWLSGGCCSSCSCSDGSGGMAMQWETSGTSVKPALTPPSAACQPGRCQSAGTV